jgi:hypothetical protein
MGKLDRETGFVRAALLLLILVLIAGALYWIPRRGVDVGEAGKSVAVDLEEAAEAIRDTSEDAILTAKVKTAIALSKSASTFDVDVDSDLPPIDDRAERGRVALDGHIEAASCLDVSGQRRQCRPAGLRPRRGRRADRGRSTPGREARGKHRPNGERDQAPHSQGSNSTPPGRVMHRATQAL